jgi:Tol biopolymer transport system component
MQAYVITFKSGSGKWQLSSNGAYDPDWSHDGKELYYVDRANSIYAVPVKEGAGALQFGSPQVVVGSWSTPAPFYQSAPTSRRSFSTASPSRSATPSPSSRISAPR